MKVFPLTNDPNDKNERIQDKIKRLIESGEIKMRDVADWTTLASSTLSQVLNDKYNADPTEVLEALNRFYKNWIATEATIQTEMLKQIQFLLDLSWSQKEIGRITARFGAGKTRAGEYYNSRNDHSVYLLLTSTESRGSFTYRLGQALGIDKDSLVGSLNDKLFTIIRSLQRKPRLLIIDEADELKAQTLAILRDIHGGSGAGRCGIVLMATQKIKTVLRDPALGYLESRIRIKWEFDVSDMKYDEVRKIVDLWEHKLSADDIKQAWSWAKSRHALRSLDALMTRAYNMMQYEKKKVIDETHLRKAYGLLVD